MQIEWRNVTWYSKALAGFLFVVLPFFGFWLGARYERATETRTENQISAPPASNLPAPPAAVASDILARTVLEIPGGQTFALPNRNDLTFTLTRIRKASGGVRAPLCGISDNFIFIAEPQNFSSPGSCIPAVSPLSAQRAQAVVIADLEIASRSNEYVSGRFLELLYNTVTEEGNVTERAPHQPGDARINIRPFATVKTRAVFLVPEEQTEVQLVYGDYGLPSPGETYEDLLGKSVGGFTVDFSAKTITDISG